MSSEKKRNGSPDRGQNGLVVESVLECAENGEREREEEGMKRSICTVIPFGELSLAMPGELKGM